MQHWSGRWCHTNVNFLSTLNNSEVCHAKLRITFTGQFPGAFKKDYSVNLEVVSHDWDWQKTDEILAHSLF